MSLGKHEKRLLAEAGRALVNAGKLLLAIAELEHHHHKVEQRIERPKPTLPDPGIPESGSYIPSYQRR